MIVLTLSFIKETAEPATSEMLNVFGDEDVLCDRLSDVDVTDFVLVNQEETRNEHQAEDLHRCPLSPPPLSHPLCYRGQDGVRGEGGGR